MKLRVWDAAALLSCAMLALPSLGAESRGEARAPEIEVLAGGIGDAELAALAMREKDFNLKLVFSLVQGNYVADVDVVVSDAKGTKVIERSADGPFVLARLPAGEYSVTATRGGRTISRKFKIAAGRLRRENLRWPADPEQDLPISRWMDRE
jgi:hypothetical protein